MTRLGDRYELTGELGRGGMAIVHRARDVRHGRDVAVKIMLPDVAEAVGAERFLREIEIAARLQHPHIVPVFDSGSVDDQLYFVMPLIEGQSLRTRLAFDGPLPVDEAVRLVREVADALDYAHGQGILHRDLKPENIMLSREHALLSDFGIARAIGQEDSARLTQVGSSIGTPSYMSPEQATGESEIGPSSDVYALASVLFELLTGVPPFTGPTFEAILVKRFTQVAPRASSVRADTPPACDAAIAKALEADPARRYATAGAFATALATTLPTSSTPTTPTALSDVRSIVVLPFVNQSPDPENEFFSDGLTEEIITDLSRVRALRVLSRTSAMQLKGTSKSVRQLGQELGIRYVLSGSVRKAGQSLRINAELIEAASDTPVWADRFSGTVDDVFDVQERVAREIVRALNVTLTTSEDRRLADRPMASPRAFELYLQARTAFRRYQIDRGHALLNEALEIEGEVPILRALRAQGRIMLVRSGMSPDHRPLDEAETEARALLEIVPDAAYGHTLLGFIGYERGDFVDGARSLYRALERDPSDPDIVFYLGVTLIGAGQPEATAELSRRATAIDPLSPITPMLAGVSLWYEGRPADGIPDIERSGQIDGENALQHWTLGYTYALVGRVGDAAREADWFAKNAPPQMAYGVQLRSLVASLQGRPQEARDLLSTVATAGLDGHTRFHLGESFAMAGDTDRALQLFRDAVGTNFYPHDFIARMTPFVEPVRHMSEFAEILDTAARKVEAFAR
ncbi:MAG: protein kinase [Cytophagaceae bacterium]|nr:protein kinase [Gemmatimonadaceae bacterium]